jgi:hypothetical protein
MPATLQTPVGMAKAHVTGEILGTLRPAAAVKIIRRCCENAAIGLQRPSHQIGVRQIANMDAELVALADQVMRIVVERQVDGDVEILVQVIDKRRHEALCPETDGRDEPQPPTWCRLQFGCRLLGKLHLRQHRLAALVIELADLGQLMTTRGAVQQARTEPLLDRPDMLGDHGW